jgi:SAM-dependent methyltransferase
MPELKPILSALSSRYERVLTGLDVAFDDAATSRQLRELRGGVWMTVVSNSEAASVVGAALPEGTVHQICDGEMLPFDDCPFEVVVLNGKAITQPLVKEIHRVLKPAGFLFFTVTEENRGKRDSTLSKIYNMFLKNGFDIVSLIRPPWWKFGFDGRTLTVCARRKSWKELKSLGGLS